MKRSCFALHKYPVCSTAYPFCPRRGSNINYSARRVHIPVLKCIWSKFNYVTSTAVDSGTDFSFFTLQFPTAIRCLWKVSTSFASVSCLLIVFSRVSDEVGVESNSLWWNSSAVPKIASPIHALPATRPKQRPSLTGLTEIMTRWSNDKRSTGGTVAWQSRKILLHTHNETGSNQQG